MLGGGVFVTQNKTLPGSYINIISASKVTSNLGDRGVVAIALPLKKDAGKVITVSASDFVQNSEDLLGAKFDSDTLKPLREIFLHSNLVYVYDLGTNKTVADVLAGLEPYAFNVLCAYTKTTNDITAYIAGIKNWRDNYGKKCQLVVYNATTPNYEGVINVISKPTSGDDHALTAWVAGAEAGCAINSSITNMLYDGEYTINTTYTQSQLEGFISGGQLAFHNVYGDTRVLEDINSLTETTADKGEDFKSNQTIRIVDQIANDIARLFNTKYLGKIPNDASGRAALWGDIVAHHRELETLRAIEDFDSSLLTVNQGKTKKSVVVTDVITVTNAMEQLYMTVIIQ